MALTDYVDPFIGVDGPGNTLCGPYLPHSIVRLGPDCACLDAQVTNGYRSDLPIKHFSHTHVSGTGGGGRYGNIGVVPFTGPPPPGSFRKEREEAATGYYAVTLQPGAVRVELTATPRVGLHRYTFPAGVDAHLRIDVGAVLQAGGMVPGDRREDGTGACIGGYVELVGDQEVVGRGDFRGGWGHTYPYSVYFALRVDRPWKKARVGNGYGVMPGGHADEANCFALLQFGRTPSLNATVGISYVSVAKARASIDREVGSNNFDAIRAEAQVAWARALSRIIVDGGKREERTLFYTLFTRMLCMPSDLGIDDEFPQWHSGVRHFTDFYTIWDSVRNANSLLLLIEPEMAAEQLCCLLDIADHTGWLPDVWIQGHHGYVQGGSSADMLFCEAALKGLPGIDYEKALRHMLKNGEVESPNPYLYGRYLTDYRDRGYLSTRVRKNCVSRHLEYAYQDWCAGVLARHLGFDAIARKAFESSGKVWNLWRDDLRCFAPRHPNGAWVEPFDQDACWPDSWNDPYFYEGTARQWSFSVHQDFPGLIDRHGGPAGFIDHLDRFFGRGQTREPTGDQPFAWFGKKMGFYHSKETMLHVPWLYTYAGRPDLTAECVRRCLHTFFQPTRAGLSDNEDMGCQSAFYMASAMGLYPIMGQDLYLLAPPVFDHVEIQIGEGGRTLVIDSPQTGEDAVYIRAARLNGKPLERPWLRHGEIARGGHLEYELSTDPASWGRDAPPPPALASHPPS